MTDTAINLKSCPPEELASWLLANRFENNAIDTASFLLQCTSTLPNAEEISAQLMGGGDAHANDEEMDEEKKEDDEATAENHSANLIFRSPVVSPFSTKEQSPLQIEVSCTYPRGKFTLQLYQNGLILTNPKKPEEMIPIPKASLENVIWFRKMEEYKKLKTPSGKKPLPGHMILICFESSKKVMFRNKELTQVCFQLPSYSQDGSDDKEQFSEEQWWGGLGTALCSEDDKMIRVGAKMDIPSWGTTSDSFVFQSEGAPGSSSTTEGMPYVGCYHGLNDGLLYPIQDGLLFFKPPLFIHRSKLASISCGRGSGSASRYVDMAVELDSKEHIEFTNIAREELGVLNDYIHKTLIPAMQADADGSESIDEHDAVAVEVVESDDDSDDLEENSDVTKSSGSKRGRPSRAASKMAREATRAHFDRGVQEDSEEDEDEEDFQSDDGSDSDDGSGSDSDGDENTDEEGIASSDDEEMHSHEEDGVETEERDMKKPRV